MTGSNLMKLAIVGAGPSAFYVASRLLSLFPKHGPKLRIHMFDRLWAPHGLVRYGVAPDHPEVKNCTHKFDEVAQDPRFSFFGNVELSFKKPGISLQDLFHKYTHIVLATGASCPILHPALPPSNYCVPALSLVHWYTSHPLLSTPPPVFEKITHVSLIGQGNVSLDIARMLLSSPDTLSKYDVPEPVLEVLRSSSVKHVSIIGRRGPYEAAFTAKELREMVNLPEASMVPLDSVVLAPAIGSTVTRQQSRIIDLLKKGSKHKYGTTSKTWSLDFFRSPTDLTISDSAKPALTLGHTMVDPVTSRAVLTSETSTIDTDLVVTSLGYRSDPDLSFYNPALGHLWNEGGRVATARADGGLDIVKNVYASGWAATGAKGVLASTMINAYAVADTMLADYLGSTAASDSAIPLRSSSDDSMDVMASDPDPEELAPEVQSLILQGEVTSYADWKKVDEEEQRRGQEKGKERERMSWDETKRFLGRA